MKKYLFFDTETTGVPRDYKAPTSDTDNWPRLVQLGWILAQEDRKEISRGNLIVRPEGFVIPVEAASVHGITTDRALKEGWDLPYVITLFHNDLDLADVIVGHNISFDIHIIGAELVRLGMGDDISSKPAICTMQQTTDFCQIPGRYGFKWPKLMELHQRLFGFGFDDAHDAMADISATAKCFWELKSRGVVDC